MALKAIRTGWDGILRFATSVRTGRVSANVECVCGGSAVSRDSISPRRRRGRAWRVEDAWDAEDRMGHAFCFQICGDLNVLTTWTATA